MTHPLVRPLSNNSVNLPLIAQPRGSPLSKSTWFSPCVHAHGESPSDTQGQDHLPNCRRQSQSRFRNQRVVDPVTGRSGSSRGNRRCAHRCHIGEKRKVFTIYRSWDRDRARAARVDVAESEGEGLDAVWTVAPYATT